MDSKSLEILEFPKIREMLGGATAFSASRDLALSLEPSSDPATVLRWLGQSAEARRFLSLEVSLTLGDTSDVREAALMAARGKVLEPETLLAIQKTMAIARRLRDSLEKADTFPLLWDLSRGMVALSSLEERIAGAIGVSGEVLDSASPELSRLRRRLKDRREKLLSRLDTIISSSRGQRFLQEPLITEREGRYVIPIKAELKKEFRGIVHDVSNTGATVFVEPWATVNLGNELRELAVAEKREVARVLAALSAEVGTRKAEIARNVAGLAAIDLALAKARFAEKVGAVEATIVTFDDDDGKSAVLKLVAARHPLLKDKAVPLSVEIGRDFSGLVVTGPNTGGKTVALKTIGLMALMTQAGLPIPAAAESVIPVFDGVFADIGDEQSIEQTLSTFSWHMGNVVRIIGHSTAASLVLLDELGTSTDPGEGAALARAILLHFLARGTMMVATSHFNELKVFAHQTPGLANASLDFDPETLAPTYHLTVGVPGGSNALVTATRLGLPETIVAMAQDLMSKGSQEMAALLRDLSREQQRVATLRAELEQDKARVENLARELAVAQQGLREREALILGETRDGVVAEAAELKRLIRRAASELKKERAGQGLEKAKEVLASVRARLGSPAWRPVSSDRGGEPKSGEIGVGDRVWLSDIDLEATVLAVDSKNRQIEVQAGVTRVRVGRDSVTKIGTAVASPGETVGSHHLSTKPVPGELDLRGQRADEVVPAVDAYLSDAYLTNRNEVRIIHGIGTGTVRQVVRGLLSGHALVASFRPGGRGEGGDGATVVRLIET